MATVEQMICFLTDSEKIFHIWKVCLIQKQNNSFDFFLSIYLFHYAFIATY